MITPTDDPDAVTRSLLYGATGREEVTQETLPLGAAISTLDAEEAKAFALACDGYARNKVAHR